MTGGGHHVHALDLGVGAVAAPAAAGHRRAVHIADQKKAERWGEFGRIDGRAVRPAVTDDVFLLNFFDQSGRVSIAVVDRFDLHPSGYWPSSVVSTSGCRRR